MNNQRTGHAKASAKLGRPRKSTYSTPKGREVREIKAEPRAENKTGPTERREQKSTDRTAHKAMLETVRKAALEAIRPLAAQVESLRQEAAKKDAEIDYLMRRLARVEANQKVQETDSGVL